MNRAELIKYCKENKIKGYSNKSSDQLKMLIESNTKIQKPFLKWVGGKSQIIKKLIKKFPVEIENYHELFLGGGSVLMALLSLQKLNKICIKNKIYAYDINEKLINVYKHIQQNKEELFKYINEYITEYDNIKGKIVNRKPLNLTDANTSKESYYYWIRKKFNKNIISVEYSAIFMFLNKTCFRGMYRESVNGYNVPYGHYKKTPTIITRKDLDYISDLIKDVIFIHSDFKDSMRNIKKGDFVYLDPPYAPENDKSFVGYTNNGFNLDDHNKLFSEIKNLNKNDVKFVLSNSKVPLVMTEFNGYSCEDLVARRAINPKNPGSTTIEVIINN
jgi:DNA adenine methylase